ncbi:hypothetical protein ABZ354_20210 [Streptomyces sp. NPDC005925]|uniref:hypothetical protein n=1 Tax=Streptomyces sp. NPDC005925 TaxID=3157172 RepID=UPI003403A28D
MTSWLCILRAAAVLATLTAGACVLPHGSYGPGGVGLSVAYGAEPSPSASVSASDPASGSAPDASEPSGAHGASPASSPARPAATSGGLPLITASAARPAPSASPPASPSPSRAGSVPGEGRLRPGRHGEGVEERREPRKEGGARPGRPDHSPDRPDRPDRPDEGGVSGEPDAGAVPDAEGTARDARPVPSGAGRATGDASPRAVGRRGVGPPLRILPLGSGLVLIGLGLGLAFFGLRLRRV